MDAEGLLANFETIASAPGGVGRLRELILQLATRGSLVPQDEEAEPVGDIVERIAREKSEATASRKTAKTPDVSKKDWRYRLPSSWMWVRLDSISAYIQRGKGPNYAESSDVPVISQKCVQWSGFKIQRARFVQPDSLENYSPERFLRPGDLLWNSTGVGTLGRVNVFPVLEQWPRVVADSHVTVIRLIEVAPAYVWCWLASPEVQGEIDSVSTGSTKQTELGTETVKNYLIPLPPLAEQQRIVAKVDELMALCDELEARQKRRHTVRRAAQTSALEALSAADSPDALARAWDRVRVNWDALTAHPDSIPPLRQAILQLAVQGKLVKQNQREEPAQLTARHGGAQHPVRRNGGQQQEPGTIEVPFALPPGWITTPVQHVLATPLSNGRSVRDGGPRGFPVLRLSALRDGRIDYKEAKTGDWTEEQAARFLVEEGNFLIARGNGSIRLVGRGCLSGRPPMSIAFPDTVIRAKPDPRVVDARFMLYSWASTYVRDQIERRARTTSGIYKISQDDVRSLAIALPPPAEQRRIVIKVDRLLALCDDLGALLQSRETTSTKLAAAPVHAIAS